MALEIGPFAVILLALILLILVSGFLCYLFRSYCQSRRSTKRDSRKLSAGAGHDGLLAGVVKTTTDDELTMKSMKTHTFDQILKQEERSAYSVHSVKLPLPPMTTAAAAATGQNHLRAQESSESA